MTNTPQWVIEKIRKVKEKRLKELDLTWYEWREGDRPLTEIPPEIFDLKWLEELDLRRNKITELPNLLVHFPQLRSFSFRWSENKQIPDWIKQILELKIDLSSNQLKIVPESISHLTNLTTLDLSFNQLTTVPESISHLTNLTTLNLSSNQLTTVPESISRLTNLTTLDLSSNQLKTVPESISRLTNLTILDLRDNKSLPIPPEIIEKIYEPATIINYYLQHQRGQTKPLNEAKVLFVGQGSVGKTSLVNRLITGNFNPEQNKTEGINIQTWSIYIKK